MSRNTPEGAVKAALKKIYAKHGDAIVLVQPIGTVFNAAGVHDHILCVGGRFVSVEVKAGSNKLSPAQEMFGARMVAAGGLALVVNEGNLKWFDGVLEIMCSTPQLTHDERGYEMAYDFSIKAFPKRD